MPFLDQLDIEEEDSPALTETEKSSLEATGGTERRKKREESYERLAAMLRKQLNIELLYAIMGL